jgi:hypothetical protein
MLHNRFSRRRERTQAKPCGSAMSGLHLVPGAASFTSNAADLGATPSPPRFLKSRRSTVVRQLRADSSLCKRTSGGIPRRLSIANTSKRQGQSPTALAQKSPSRPHDNSLFVSGHAQFRQSGQCIIIAHGARRTNASVSPSYPTRSISPHLLAPRLRRRAEHLHTHGASRREPPNVQPGKSIERKNTAPPLITPILLEINSTYQLICLGKYSETSSS